MIKVGTVCYLVNLPKEHAFLAGRVVTVTGPEQDMYCAQDKGTWKGYPCEPKYRTGYGVVIGYTRASLLPISDPPSDVPAKQPERLTA